MNFKSEGLYRFAGLRIRDIDLYFKGCSFFGYHLQTSFGRDNLNDIFAIPHNDALYSDPAGASAADYFCFRAMQFGAR